jgi:hypothetical protein
MDMKNIFIIFFFVLVSFLSMSQAHAQNITVQEGQEFKSQTLSLPYAFYNENFGFAGGWVYGVSGWPQKQMTMLISAVLGTNDTFVFYFLEKDMQLLPFERLFLDSFGMVGTFGTIESYTDGNSAFPFERAGSNKSDKDNFIEADGDDSFFEIKFKYLLPIGHGRDKIINTYIVDKGILVSGASGGTSWNPYMSGRTYLEVKPFYRRQNIDDEFDKNFDKTTNGLEFSAFHDNTDFSKNPSTGSALRLRVVRDWQWADSSAPWTIWDAEYSKYFSLGPSDKFRQRVIALNFWTADTPTWDSSHSERGQTVFHRPPPFKGATLGGLFRMRAFPATRFNDQAAIYYSAEYRMIPKWNPIAKIAWLQKHLQMAWWQLVPFVEVGRVAEKWTVNELHSDMKWDVGLGLRAMVKGLVVRLDMAVSKEDFGVQMMVSQPFNF